MLGEVRRWAFWFRISRWNIKIETVLGSEQTQCQIDDMFFVWLTCHSLAQQVSHLLFERMAVLCRSLFQPGVESSVNIADQKTRHAGFPQLLASDSVSVQMTQW